MAETRRIEIIAELQEEGSVKTSDLASRFSVSEVTIRRDLEKLAEQGKLNKVHGGAVEKGSGFVTSYESRSIATEPTFKEKSEINKEEKKRIGERAASLIEEDSVIFIGNGTTAMQITKNLNRKKNLSVLTNSLNHGIELSKINTIDVLIVGGQLRKNSYALVGPVTKRSLDKLYVDILFLGVNGISIKHGLTIPSLIEADTAHSIIEMASDVVIVADYSKFGKVSHAKIADVGDIDTVITDDKVPEKYETKLSELGVELLIA